MVAWLFGARERATYGWGKRWSMSGQTVARATAMNTPPDIKRVLVIDDDPTILELVRHALGRLDRYEVVTAVNGADGLQSYFDAQPDCVIVDIGMPVMDGF